MSAAESVTVRSLVRVQIQPSAPRGHSFRQFAAGNAAGKHGRDRDFRGNFLPCRGAAVECGGNSRFFNAPDLPFRARNARVDVGFVVTEHGERNVAAPLGDKPENFHGGGFEFRRLHLRYHVRLFAEGVGQINPERFGERDFKFVGKVNEQRAGHTGGAVGGKRIVKLLERLDRHASLRRLFKFKHPRRILAGHQRRLETPPFHETEQLREPIRRALGGVGSAVNDKLVFVRGRPAQAKRQHLQRNAYRAVLSAGKKFDLPFINAGHRILRHLKLRHQQSGPAGGNLLRFLKREENFRLMGVGAGPAESAPPVVRAEKRRSAAEHGGMQPRSGVLGAEPAAFCGEIFDFGAGIHAEEQ